MTKRTLAFASAAAFLALGGCNTAGDLVVQEGVGITALRSVCPAVGVPDYTGDVTLFTREGARTADALDVTAAITNVRSACDENGGMVYTEAQFDVVALRRNTNGERTVELPYFSTVMRGGSAVIAKKIGSVQLYFADGAARAQVLGKAGSFVSRAEATVPADIRARITRKRKAGEESAAIDPLTEPDIKAALERATFELLIGFQLTEDQLAYNATR